MTYPRVNLLKKSEQRYQGAVSRRFIMVSAVVTPILLIAVLSGIKLVQYSGVQADLKTSREIWKDLKPKLELFNEENKSLAANRKILALFEGWRQSQLPIVKLMDEVQDVVPQNVQFSRFSLRGDITKAAYATPKDMKLNYKLLIEGVAQGNRAEEDVWKFQKDLIGSPDINRAFETVDLADMRKRQSGSGVTLREFKLVGKVKEGGKK